jgi:hypothetical protein
MICLAGFVTWVIPVYVPNPRLSWWRSQKASLCLCTDHAPRSDRLLCNLCTLVPQFQFQIKYFFHCLLDQFVYLFFWCGQSSGWTTKWTVRVSNPGRGKRFYFCFFKMSQTDLGVKRPGRGADKSLSCNAAAKNDWSYTSTRRNCLHSVYIDSFTSYT